LESVENGPLLWPTVEEDGVTWLKKYSELSAAKAIQADCNIKATNIILQGLPPEVYALVSTHKVAKELWERIQMLMQGMSLTNQERGCKLYDEFDKFTYRKEESLPKVKTINDEVRIQALIDEKRVKLKESSILRTLKLDDAEGKNIEAGVPFFMFPKFVQLLIDHQPGNMSHHKQIYDNPSLIKKVFANMKRVGTSFSGVVTPLFDNMLVPAANEVGLVRYKKSIGLSIELSLSP
nr:hypothetical protein [Tanacetum cinerariifolium]